MGTQRSHARRFRALLAAFLVVAFLSGSLGTVPTAQGRDSLSDALSQQRALRAKIATQQKHIAALRSSEAKLTDTLAATQKSLDSINADQVTVQANIADAKVALAEVRSRYKALVGEVDGLTFQLTVLEDDMQQGEEQLAASRRLLARHIADAYETQQTSLLEQLLTAGSLADVLADVGYYMASGDQDNALAEQIEQDQAALEQFQRSLTVTRTQVQATRMQVRVQNDEMTRQMQALAAAQQRLAKLEADTKAAQAQQMAAFNAVKRTRTALAAELRKEQQALDDLQQEINRLLDQDRGSVPSVYNGTLIWPMSGIVTQEFGCTGFASEPPSGSCSHFHNGIDIATAKYTPIHAAGDGVVMFAGPNPYDPPGARAWIVIIAHSQNLLTWYAHVDNDVHPPAVQKGQFVHQGDVIAYEGNTGNSTGPHLHWMVELNGTFVNPRMFT